MSRNAAIVVHKSGADRKTTVFEADPITTEVMRHALNSAANQMKRAVVRTAFSPIIYEVLDFAVALYDPQIRLLAQAPTLPLFMGTLGFCIEGAVAGVGGPDNLAPGDVILYNWPYGTGAHANDMSLVMPVFLDAKELIGYTVTKAHWLDIAGKDPYSTDTIDVFQEGTVYPGVRIYKAGVLNEDVYRIVLANTRVPKPILGDLNSQIVGCRAGAAGLERVVKRFGLANFRNSVEHMFDHGEKVVRSYLERVPDGRYVATGELDNDGISDDPIPFEIAVEVKGSNITIDFTKAPDQRTGPFNSPLPSTVSISRLSMAMLAGFGEPPNEGHFRPIEVVTRAGSMFHPTPPAPCFLYPWPALQAVEVIFGAIAKALPEAVPAQSGNCLCSMVWWGTRAATGEPWAEGAPHPTGQGAWCRGDGSTQMIISMSGTQTSPLEVWESRNPWVTDKMELARDSGGPGRYRGGCGIDYHFHMLEDAFITPVIDRTKNPPAGLAGGGSARPNNARVRFPDGRVAVVPKTTRFFVPKGSVLEITTGGGGGYGPPAARDAAAVAKDLLDGYISPEFAARHYPHATK